MLKLMESRSLIGSESLSGKWVPYFPLIRRKHKDVERFRTVKSQESSLAGLHLLLFSVEKV